MEFSAAPGPSPDFQLSTGVAEGRAGARWSASGGIFVGMPGGAASSLREIVLVSHDERRIEVYQRTGDGWSGQAAGSGEAISLDSIACRLDVDLLYDRAGA